MLQRILALIIKEFLALLRDPKSRVVTFVPPLIQLVVFGYAASFDLNNVPFAVYDQDHGAAAREVIAAFTGSPTLQLTRVIRNDSEIQPLLDAREVMMVLRLEPRFSEKLLTSGSGELQILLDGRNSNTAQVALNYASEIVAEFNQRWSLEHGLQAPPAQLIMRAWYNPNLESRWFFIPGVVGILCLVVTLVVTALSVAREREHGTFDQLLVTPLRPLEILIGKSTPAFLIGVTEATLVILIGHFWFRVPLIGDLAALYSGIVLFVLAAIGIGLMISSLAQTLQQAVLGAFLFMVPAVILSGFATPIANMPWVVQLLTYGDPLRYFLVILRGVFLEGTPLDLLTDQLWPMALIAMITLSSASWLFRHRTY
jgi:ABC-2 type transport system permease protein